MSLLFSIIIPTYNRKGVLLRCLNAIGEQEGGLGDAELIVVDDGSTDGTAEALADVRPGCSFTVLALLNGGPGHARNEGARRAQGTYLVFTEDDVIPDRTWLAAIRRRLGAGTVDVLEGRTVSGVDRSDIRRFERKPVPSFIPCNLVVRRELFEAAGGYDDAFFNAATGLYFREDAELGFRLLEKGARVVVSREPVVEHPPQFPDLSSAQRHARRYIFDPLLYRKHPLLFRRMIEVKSLGPFTVHRPMHVAALGWGCLLAGALFLAAMGMMLPAVFCLGGAALCALAIRYKYQGRQAFRFAGVVGFFFLPGLYLKAVISGCVRFRSYGALV